MPRRPETPDPQDSATRHWPVSRKNLSKRDLARELNVSIRTIDWWMHEKKIPYKKLGSRLIRFDLDRVETALERFTIREVS
jgi:excisionase family DNA binding protein